MVIMNDLEWPMLSYYVIYYEKFRKIMQQTEMKYLTNMHVAVVTDCGGSNPLVWYDHPWGAVAGAPTSHHVLAVLWGLSGSQVLSGPRRQTPAHSTTYSTFLAGQQNDLGYIFSVYFWAFIKQYVWHFQVEIGSLSDHEYKAWTNITTFLLMTHIQLESVTLSWLF